MYREILWKWLALAGMCGVLLQPTVGCPNNTMIRGVFSSSLQSLVTGLLGLYVEAGANELFNI